MKDQQIREIIKKALLATADGLSKDAEDRWPEERKREAIQRLKSNWEEISDWLSK